jgi:uncharacterized membrane protein
MAPIPAAIKCIAGQGGDLLLRRGGALPGAKRRDVTAPDRYFSCDDPGESGMMRPPMTLRAAVAGLLVAASLPVALPAQGHPVRAVLFYSPTCPHCHKVIQQDLPGIFAQVGGEPVFYQGTAGHVLENRGLALLLVNTFEPAGHALFDEVAERHHIPVEQRGVPLLLCRDSVLIGDLDIPAIFPRLIQAGRAAGGTPWPAIPELAAVFPQGYDPGLAARGPTIAAGPAAPDSTAAHPASGQPGDTPRPRVDSTPPVPARPPAARPDSGPRAAGPEVGRPARGDSARARAVPSAPPARPETGATTDSGAARVAAPANAPAPTPMVPADVLQSSQGSVLLRTLRTDPVGGSLALALLLVMALSLVWVLARPPVSGGPSGHVAVPVLVVVGVAIAAYLGYVETTGATAVCGPVGDCNAVQQSAYARLFGVLPVALIGLAGYLAILAAWLVAWLARGRIGDWAAVVAFALVLAGTSASLTLTVLEPFVIGAVCAWCLTSSAVMTALLWLLAGPGMAAARAVREHGA